MTGALPARVLRTAGPSGPARAAAWLRARGWRAAFGLVGGLSVEGALPRGGCVVVANHGSHADTAALLAGLGARSAPRVAAAADHWYATPGRALTCRVLAAGFPVRRGGGGSQDLAAAAALLRRGHAVVVFPEGTRSRDGEVGPFRSGALRLAADAGVPVVPVGLAGTAALLPPEHGAPVGRGPVAVRIGPPLHRPSPDQARAAVLALSAAPAVAPLSPLAARARRLATSRRAPMLVAGWALAEALSWPLVPELAVGLLVLAAPRTWLRLALAAAAGSVAGGVLALLLAGAGVVLPQPLTTPRMAAHVAAQLSERGAPALRSQPLSGVPYKVWAAEAGRQRLPVAAFAAQSALARGGRLLAVAAGLALAGTALRRLLERRYGALLALVLPGFALSLARVVASWS